MYSVWYLSIADGAFVWAASRQYAVRIASDFDCSLFLSVGKPKNDGHLSAGFFDGSTGIWHDIVQYAVLACAVGLCGYNTWRTEYRTAYPVLYRSPVFRRDCNAFVF